MSRRRTIGIVVAVIAALLAVVVTRAVWQGRSSLTRGDQALEDGRALEAIGHWSRAARWYVPLAPHVGGAYERLEGAALAAQKAGDDRLALSAWRGIRSSALATRSFYTPFSEPLERANQQIAVLMASLEGPNADARKSESERAQWHLDLLQKPVGPRLSFTLIAIAGFLAWIGGAFWFAWGGLGENERLNRPVAARAGALIAVGLLTWLVGLYFA